MPIRTQIVCLGLLLVSLQLVSNADDSPRHTPTVKLIQRIEQAVVPVFADEGNGNLGSGSGAVISSRGYIITADHVTNNFPGVVLFGLTRVPYEIIGRLPERDIAVLKVDAANVQSVISLGRSHDLRPGEPIVVGGNPGGRGVVFSTGIVNSPSIDPSWPNVFVKSYWRNEMQEAALKRHQSTGGRPDFIQFDASSNRGNSGGPLLNAEGHLIGVVSQKSFEEESINWAIPVDRIRMVLPYLIQPEVIGDFWVGLEIDTLAEMASVKRVVKESPAWQAGLREEDVLLAVNKNPVKTGVDWLFQLYEHKLGDQLKLSWDRDGETMKGEIELAQKKSETTIAEGDKETGLDYALYRGRFASLPDFTKLIAVETGTTKGVSYEGIIDQEATNFAIVFTGYMKFPDAGVYRMYLGSDDCSKLYIDDQLVIDNGLAHPYQELSRSVRVPRGLVPFRIEYSETSGGKGLKLYAKRDIESEETVSLEYFRDSGK